MKKRLLPRVFTLLMILTAILPTSALPVEAEELMHDHDGVTEHVHDENCGEHHDHEHNAIPVSGRDYCEKNPDSILHVWNNGVCNWCGISCTHSYGSDGNCTICGMPHEHVFTKTGRTEPTCTESGSDIYTCSICGETRNEPIPELFHIIEDVPAVDPTYTEAGHTAGTRCSRCGQTLSGLEVIPVLEKPECEKSSSGKHIAEEVPAVSATCTEEGTASGTKCRECGQILSGLEIIPAGHIYEEEPAVSPTCTEEGRASGRRCTRCGHSEGYGSVAPLGHNRKETFRTESTCVTKGSVIYTCERCGDQSQEELPVNAANHVRLNTIPAIAATCTSEGKTEGTVCADCGTILSAQQSVSKKAHTAVNDPGTSPSCLQEGLSSGSHCADCGTVLAPQVSLPATGHTWVDGTCTNCGLTCSHGLYGADNRCTVCGMMKPAPVQIEFGTKTIESKDTGSTITHVSTPETSTQKAAAPAPVEIVRFVDQDTSTSFVDTVVEYTEEKNDNGGDKDVKSAEDYECKFMGKTYSTHDWKSRYTNDICIRCQYTKPHQVDHYPDRIVSGPCFCHTCGYTEHHWVFDKAAKRYRCDLCKRFCDHSKGFKSQDGKDVCKECGTRQEHDWVKGTCTRCRKSHGSHTWKDNGKNCLCTVCGKEQAHKRKNKNGTCICTTCGNTTWHAWRDDGNKNCKCEVCGKKQKHSWKSVGSREVCTGCEKFRNHSWKKSDSHCVCRQCGVKAEHNWKDDGKKDKCTRCGEKKNHDLVFVKSRWDCRKCRDCQKNVDHEFRDKDGWCVCRECGAKQEHQWVVQPKKLFQSQKDKCDFCGKTRKI